MPLLVVGAGVEPSVHDGMLSHLDLQGIVGHYLAGLSLPATREDVLVVGHTGRWVYGQITDGGGHLFLDAMDGVLLSARGDLRPGGVFERFQAAIDALARYQ